MVRIFPNEQSALRLIATLAMEQSEDWTQHYLDMSLLEEWAPLDEELSRGVMKITGLLDQASLTGQLASSVPERAGSQMSLWARRLFKKPTKAWQSGSDKTK